jgi:hypothetical protein
VGRSYHDSDDKVILHFGHPANAADRRAITALVNRYYAAAAAEDGATACALSFSILAESLPEDFGHAPGPLFLRGANTCTAVLTRIFTHNHAQFVELFKMTGARVEGNEGRVLLGSTTKPASFNEVKRERGVWKIDRARG